MPQEISQEQYREIIEDATYLQDEAEALRYVIDAVPYEESAPDNTSILEKLLLLDYIQVKYYRPVFEKIDSRVPDNDQIHIRDFSAFCRTFETDEEERYDIQKVLGKLSKHRAALINIFRKIPLIDWEHNLYIRQDRISLYGFAQDMIRNDRLILKEIADMVMIYQKDSRGRREIQSHTVRKQTQN